MPGMATVVPGTKPRGFRGMPQTLQFTVGATIEGIEATCRHEYLRRVMSALEGGYAPVMHCRQEVRSNPLGDIEETSGDLQKLTDTCAVLCSAGAGASDNIDG